MIKTSEFYMVDVIKGPDIEGETVSSKQRTFETEDKAVSYLNAFIDVNEDMLKDTVSEQNDTRAFSTAKVFRRDDEFVLRLFITRCTSLVGEGKVISIDLDALVSNSPCLLHNYSQL